MVKQEYDDYLKFIEEGLQLAQQLPRYFSKFSKKKYDNQQKVTLLVFKQKLKTTFRGIVSWLRSNSLVCELLGLTTIPVHTTLVRFAARVEKSMLRMLGIRQAHIAAVDATGFELESKSFYFRKRQDSERLWKTRRYLKLSIAVDAQKQLILTCKIRKKLRHDTMDFKHLLEDLKIDYVVADKGYDSWKNRRFVINKLHAVPVIPVRRHTHFYGYLRGCKKIDGGNYHQRSKVETIFSVIKRKYGSVVRARSFATQKVEVMSKLIAYNIDRTVNYLLVLIRGLHQSRTINNTMKGKKRYYDILLQTIPFLLGILFSYLFWRNNVVLTAIYIVTIIILLVVKYFPGDLFALGYGFVIGFIIEVIGTSVSGYQSFTNPNILGIPLWLPFAWAYGFMLMKRIGVIFTNHKK